MQTTTTNKLSVSAAPPNINTNNFNQKNKGEKCGNDFSQVTTPTPRDQRRLLIEVGRTLRLEFRNLHHVNVRSATQCEALCATNNAIRCVTFAYNRISRECLLSSTRIGQNREFPLVTQPNANYDLYALNRTSNENSICGQTAVGETEGAPNATTSASLEVKNSTKNGNYFTLSGLRLKELCLLLFV